MISAFRSLFATILFAFMALAAPVFAQVPVSELAKPPVDATRYIVISSAGKHGDYATWTTADGTKMFRESILLRGMVWEMDTAIRPGSDGVPVSVVVRGVNPSGDAAETFTITDGQARWKSQIDSGNTVYTSGALYLPYAGAFNFNTDFFENLVKAPGQRRKLLPSGEIRLEKLVTVSVGEGAAKQAVTGYAVHGMYLSPFMVWVDSRDKFFGFIGGLSLLPAGYESVLPVLEKAQTDALAAQSPILAKKFSAASLAPVAFAHVRLYDSVNTRFLDDQTVIADQGRIVAVGSSGQVAIPANARTIDGGGKTLVPGLWDAHMHVGGDFTGPMLLAIGVTSARDPGGSISLVQDRAARKARGELLFPTVYSSMLIDGKGPLAAQVGTAVSSLEEAIAAIHKAKAAGLTGIKFYTSFNPAWLAPAIAEAKRLGLHVHGHVPAGIRAMDAIKAGYDEINHINFIMMQALPDDVIAKSNGIMRFEGPGRYAKDVDINAEPIKSLIETMASRKIYSDPTLVAFEGLYVPESGDLSPAYAPFLGTLPAAMERASRSGGFAVPAGLTRADYRASFAKMQALLFAMHKAGVPIVSGTDGSGLELVHELELYVDSGMTPAEALQAATLSPARLVGADKTTGSIEVGKEADMVLVDGDPSRRIGDLRHVEWVMSDGALMNGDELRAAAGFSGRLK